MGARQQNIEEIAGPRLGLKHIWVLNLLSHYSDRSLSLAEIARGLDLTERGVQPAVDDLHRWKMIRQRAAGDGARFSLDGGNAWTRQARAMLNLVYLDPLLDDLSTVSHKVVLFGEAAHGGEARDRAIDLFIVTTARDRKRVLHTLESSPLNGRLRPTVVDGEELAALPQRNRALYDQVSRGVVLWER
jgi:hypothetical protein